MKPKPHYFGKIRISGEALDGMLADKMDSNLNVLEMLEYDRANDMWTFLCSGPDFYDVLQDCAVPYIDAKGLSAMRDSRLERDDS